MYVIVILFLLDEILRSNAIEIIRYAYEIEQQIDPKFNKIRTETLYKKKNSGEPKVHLRHAPKYLQVKYVMAYFDNI